MEGCGPRGVRVSRHRAVHAITSVYSRTCDIRARMHTFLAESLACDGGERVVDTMLRHTGTNYHHTLPSRFTRCLRHLAHPSHALADTPRAVHEARATWGVGDNLGRETELNVCVGQQTLYT